MTVADDKGYPWSFEGTIPTSPENAYHAVTAGLESIGYRLQELQPPGEITGDSSVTGTFRATIDNVRDAGIRRQGKVMLGAGVALTLVLLYMLSENIGAERWIVSPLLLLAVLAGGLGMNRLREPAQQVRTVLYAKVQGDAPFMTQLAVTGGTALVSGDDERQAWDLVQDFAVEDNVLRRVMTSFE